MLINLKVKNEKGEVTMDKQLAVSVDQFSSVGSLVAGLLASLNVDGTNFSDLSIQLRKEVNEIG